MEILTGQQMQRADRHAIETLRIPSLLLMESAGRGVAEAVLREHPGASSLGILVLCGKGNNGGDGLVAARHLARAGLKPTVVLLASGKDLEGDAAVSHRAALGSGLTVHEAPDAPSWGRVAPFLEAHGLVVDALLGTGAHGGARGFLAKAVEDVNVSKARVLAVDLPSGLDADTTSVEGAAVRAARTYTLCRPKLCLVLGPSSEHAGSWIVIPIGIPQESITASQPDLEWTDRAAVHGLLPRRRPDTHKGTYGHLLAVAGSRNKSGAAVLLARAALRTGAGLVTVATVLSAQKALAAREAEVMTELLPENSSGAIAEHASAATLGLLHGKTALAVGPGLGREPETLSAALAIAAGRTVPAVLDADGLNAVAAVSDGLARIRDGSRKPLVLTPHTGEAARLLREETSTVQADRVGAARRLARESGAVVVLKGHRTVVTSPDLRVSINSTGNPGMATAGMGDVLTGMIGALLARGLLAKDAARLGAFVHGDAGDRVAEAHGVEGMKAGDVIACLPAAFQALQAPAETAPW